MLTIFFVMLTEVCIYAPSIGRYRLVYMEGRIAAAHLASLAMEAPRATGSSTTGFWESFWVTPGPMASFCDGRR